MKSVSETWFNDQTIYEVNIRQYTEEGTIQAFRSHLPRLKSMGVGILWMMPVHPIGEINRKGTPKFGEIISRDKIFGFGNNLIIISNICRDYFFSFR